MKDESNQGTDRAEREPESTRFSPTRMAAAGIGSAIILLVIMIIILLMGRM
jgi:hypothetical protein